MVNSIFILIHSEQTSLFVCDAVTPKKKKNNNNTERGSGVDKKFDFLNRCSDGRSETADAKISSKRDRFTINMIDSEVGWITCE
jgi:hypothetical protein